MSRLLDVLVRRQATNQSSASLLDRKFTLTSLILLNVANSVGSGIFILTGMASKLFAGQFVAISYLLAGIACFLSALCFAELASRVKSSSGSSYSFLYATLGEIFAYVNGWLVFIGALTSIAATALTWSSYLDAAFDNRIKNFTITHLHLSWNLRSPFTNYLDLPALLICILLFLISLRGIHLTTLFNNTLAILNLFLLAVICLGGFAYGDLANLTNVNYSNGVEGVLKGSSVVMYAFFGFESSTFAIDETISPAKTVPLSMLFSILILNLAYCGASVSLNLMQPFDQIDPKATYPSAFRNHKFMHLVVAIGPIVSLTGTLITTVYTIARVLFSMSSDGLVFKFLSRVNENTKVPDSATIVSAIMCTCLVAFIDVANLIGFTDIVGFLTYSSVAVALLVVRYYGGNENELDGLGNEYLDGDDSVNQVVESSLMNSVYQNEESTNLIETSTNERHSSAIKRSSKGFGFFRRRRNVLLVILFDYLGNLMLFGLMHNLKLYTVFNYKLVLMILAAILNLLVCLVLCMFEQVYIPDVVLFKVTEIYKFRYVE